MSIFSKVFRKKYLGYVSARTQYVDNDGEVISGRNVEGRYLLHKSIFGRGCKLVGDGGNSVLATVVKSEVEAWILGGPLPNDFIPHKQVPETNEPNIVIKEGNVLAFPKGNGEQA